MKKLKNCLKIRFFLILLFLLSSTFSIVIAGNNYANKEIVVEYFFETPKVSSVVIDGDFYNLVAMPEVSCGGNIGSPSLPQKESYILLPLKSEITDIEVIPGEKVFIGSGFYIEPVCEPFPIIKSSSNKKLTINTSVYNSRNVYPEELFNIIGTYSFRGYNILVLLLNPVQYIPLTGELFYFKNLKVKIKTVENNIISPMYRGLFSDKIMVIKKVDNPFIILKEDFEASSSENYDMLIITTEELKNGFEPLKSAHDANGVKTIIKTLSDIKLLPSKVTPEDIRDYIRNFYKKYGIQYVLIGGDADVVPAKQLWVQAWPGGDNTEMPSDLYYGCLDGTFNYDDDDFWGEPNDGDNGKDVDLFAEVYVGRACVGDISEVNIFVNKTLYYLNNGGYLDGKVLMVGEYLWSNPDTWGDDYMEELIDGSNANAYTTVGIPSSVYNIDRLYEKNWPDNNWPVSELITRINNGVRIINHLGHASYGYCMKMYNEDVYLLVNPEPFFVYSQGCMAGGFDDPNNYDCIAEYLTVKTEYAAFAAIMNARYGWGVVGGTDGGSQRYHRQFWDAVFGEGITELGKANQDSKEDNLYRIYQPVMRWCYYQLNLFGDPALAFFTTENSPPEKPEKPFGLSIGKINQQYNFTTNTTDVDEDKIFYKWDFGDGTFSKWLGPFNSGETVIISHNWSKKGLYNVKVKARDSHRAESPWSEPLSIKITKPRTFNYNAIIRLLQRFTFLKFIF
ncbi:MAG: C25 family cysteine peptidase [Thermoplasmatota archaeon]